MARTRPRRSHGAVPGRAGRLGGGQVGACDETTPGRIARSDAVDGARRLNDGKRVTDVGMGASRGGHDERDGVRTATSKRDAGAMRGDPCIVELGGLGINPYDLKDPVVDIPVLMRSEKLVYSALDTVFGLTCEQVGAGSKGTAFGSELSRQLSYEQIHRSAYILVASGLQDVTDLFYRGVMRAILAGVKRDVREWLSLVQCRGDDLPAGNLPHSCGLLKDFMLFAETVERKLDIVACVLLPLDARYVRRNYCGFVHTMMNSATVDDDVQGASLLDLDLGLPQRMPVLKTRDLGRYFFRRYALEYEDEKKHCDLALDEVEDEMVKEQAESCNRAQENVTGTATQAIVCPDGRSPGLPLYMCMPLRIMSAVFRDMLAYCFQSGQEEMKVLQQRGNVDDGAYDSVFGCEDGFVALTAHIDKVATSVMDVREACGETTSGDDTIVGPAALFSRCVALLAVVAPSRATVYSQSFHDKEHPRHTLLSHRALSASERAPLQVITVVLVPALCRCIAYVAQRCLLQKETAEGESDGKFWGHRALFLLVLERVCVACKLPETGVLSLRDSAVRVLTGACIADTLDTSSFDDNRTSPKKVSQYQVAIERTRKLRTATLAKVGTAFRACFEESFAVHDLMELFEWRRQRGARKGQWQLCVCLFAVWGAWDALKGAVAPMLEDEVGRGFRNAFQLVFDSVNADGEDVDDDGGGGKKRKHKSRRKARIEKVRGSATVPPLCKKLWSVLGTRQIGALDVVSACAAINACHHVAHVGLLFVDTGFSPDFVSSALPVWNTSDTGAEHDALRRKGGVCWWLASEFAVLHPSVSVDVERLLSKAISKALGSDDLAALRSLCIGRALDVLLVHFASRSEAYLEKVTSAGSKISGEYVYARLPDLANKLPGHMKSVELCLQSMWPQVVLWGKSTQCEAASGAWTSVMATKRAIGDVSRSSSVSVPDLSLPVLCDFWCIFPCLVWLLAHVGDMGDVINVIKVLLTSRLVDLARLRGDALLLFSSGNAVEKRELVRDLLCYRFVVPLEMEKAIVDHLGLMLSCATQEARVQDMCGMLGSVRELDDYGSYLLGEQTFLKQKMPNLFLSLLPRSKFPHVGGAYQADTCLGSGVGDTSRDKEMKQPWATMAELSGFESVQGALAERWQQYEKYLGLLGSESGTASMNINHKASRVLMSYTPAGAPASPIAVSVSGTDALILLTLDIYHDASHSMPLHRLLKHVAVSECDCIESLMVLSAEWHLVTLIDSTTKESISLRRVSDFGALFATSSNVSAFSDTSFVPSKKWKRSQMDMVDGVEQDVYDAPCFTMSRGEPAAGRLDDLRSMTRTTWAQEVMPLQTALLEGEGLRVCKPLTGDVRMVEEASQSKRSECNASHRSLASASVGPGPAVNVPLQLRLGLSRHLKGKWSEAGDKTVTRTWFLAAAMVESDLLQATMTSVRALLPEKYNAAVTQVAATDALRSLLDDEYVEVVDPAKYGVNKWDGSFYSEKCYVLGE